MNDFTKKELGDLLIWGETFTEFGDSWLDDIHRPLINKLQSMFDNYCAHEWWSGCAHHRCSPDAIWCSKCKEDLVKEY